VRRLLRQPLALAGMVVVGLFALAAVGAPVLAPHEPNAVDVIARLESPSQDHLLGTDALGRDLFSRLLFGARWSLGAAFVVTVLVTAIGVAVGAVSGYLGGRVDAVAMRVVDALLAFPSILLALAIVGVVGPGLRGVLGGLVLVGWAGYARVVRGVVLGVREHEYVQAARAVGGSDTHILRRHVLPNVVSPVVVLASLEMGQLILALAGLSFLGLGAQPPAPEWGTMLNDGRVFLLTAPQLMIYPGVAISLVVLGLNLLGDGLRDVLDPRTEILRTTP
jgi:ABC-type dipeptide/oligopeptide/nickel transport system permease subunit